MVKISEMGNGKKWKKLGGEKRKNERERKERDKREKV